MKNYYCPKCNQKYVNVTVWPIRCVCGSVIQEDETITQDNLLAKIGSLTKATMQHAVNKFKDVPEEVFKRRISICESCPLFNTNRSCDKCGCNMDLKAKWPQQQCPLNKWEKYEEDNNSN